MTILFFLLSIACLAVRESLQYFRHSKSIFDRCKHGSFFGKFSWTRKYEKAGPNSFSSSMFELPPNNLYYRFFKIEYKERFPLSATALVFLTDGFHLMQWLAINFFTLSIAFALGDVLITFIWLRLTAALVWWFIFEVALKKR